LRQDDPVSDASGVRAGQRLPDEPVFCLAESELFRDLGGEEMASIAARAGMQAVDAGTVVWSPAAPQPVLFIVKAGRVSLYRLAAGGRRLTLAILGPGGVFGQMPLVGQRMGQGYAETLEPSVLCLMSEQDVREMLLTDPRIAGRITEGLGRRLAEVEQRLADTVLKSAPQRVAAVLLRLSSAPAPPGLLRARPAEVRLTHEQLAELVGTTRETTSKVLGDLKDAGAVRLRRGGVVVLDRDRLQAAADDLPRG
jgi:CRP/FNR family cyclic AMP-dependent transcriptional regulator